MFVALIVGLPFSLPLLYRLYRVHIDKQPAIDPDCNNFGLKLGKAILWLSKLMLIASGAVYVGTLVYASAGSGSASGVPGAIVLILAFLCMLAAVLFIELSQISYRRRYHKIQK